MRLGRYELLYRLAKGGMGEVFVARRKGPGDIEKRVVIKRIRRDLSGDPRFVDMFLREARVSMTLSHKNIAAVFDFGRAGQELFLAMEHVHGRDLARAVRAAGDSDAKLSAAAVAYIGIEVCRALDYAHKSSSASEPIIHRDLSPKNLLLSFSGEVVVADFGLAVESSAQLNEGGVRGTPAYLSPEQARGEALDGRSDLFSLGLVLRELVTGEPAYRGDSPKQIIAQAREAQLGELPGDVPEALRGVIDKATAAEKSDRFSNAWAMQTALDEYLIVARAAGAAAPGREIAQWLGALFDEDDTTGQRGSSGGELAAVTFLDDGEEAVSREARELGEAVTGSIAETVADSEFASAALDPSDGQPADAEQTTQGRGWWFLAATVAIAAAATTFAIRSGGSPSDGSENSSVAVTSTEDARAGTTDRGVIAIPSDAGAPESGAADAGVLDAATLDAAVRPAPSATGWLRVQSRPWARVSVRGSAGCPETPCRIKLPAGKHTVKLKNPVTGASTSRRVNVRANTTADLSVTLPTPGP